MWCPRCRQGRQHLHPESLAGHVPDHLGRPGPFRGHLLCPLLQGSQSKDWRDWPYLTGDAAVEAEDGYYRILGRIDDVINVSGHRLGTKEIESAALVVEEVAEAAVVPVNHEIKGKEPDLYIALKPGVEASDELAKKISDASAPEIGKIAKPRKVWIVKTCPRPVPARSCAACWAPCPTIAMWAMS
jgi:acyl-coenzyme A synthetase/AMP-(fatty) acid ligase